MGVPTVLSITNPQPAHTIVFKIKTNAPRRYSIKPTMGILAPGQAAEVAVQAVSGFEASGPDKLAVFSMGSTSPEWVSLDLDQLSSLVPNALEIALFRRLCCLCGCASA